MTLEMLVDELRQLERPIRQDARSSLLADLRNYPTDIDGRRSIKWERGNVYFHALQDTLYADGVFRGTMVRCGKEGLNYLKSSQACFVKDLDQYLAGFPEEESEMRQLFELIFKVGTSAYWEDHKELLIGLNRLYWTLDREVIRPWVEQTKNKISAEPELR